MVIGGLPMYADVTTTGVVEDITTDGSESSSQWFQMFDIILADKGANALKFYLVLDALKDIEVSEVQTVLNENTTRANLLLNYGLDATKIQQIMMYYLDDTVNPQAFPGSIGQLDDDVDDYGRNIYSDIYYDEDLVYSNYMVRFYDYLNDQYANLTPTMKAPISTWDVQNQGEIHVFQNVLNLLIRDFIFHVETNTTTSVVTKEMFLRPQMQNVIYTELDRLATFNGTVANQTDLSEYAQMFYQLGNVILKTAENQLKVSTQIDNAIDLGDLVKRPSDTLGLVLRTSVSDDPIIINTITPSILATPDFATVFLNPDVDAGESDNIQFSAEVFDSGSGVVWSIEENPAVSIDQNGLATINEGYVQDVNSPETLTVTATLENNAGISDQVTLLIEYNAPLAGVRFFGPYIKGYKDGTFKTKKNVTRAEAAAMFTRILSLDAKTETIDGEEQLLYTKDKIETPTYSDIEKEHWAFLNIEIATAENMLSGYDDGTFKPNEAMTRAEVAVLIANAWDALDIEKDIRAKHEIIDVKPGHWAYAEINSVFNAMVVNGFDDNSFKPEELISREQVVTMINNIISRPEYLLPGDRFSDVSFGYWAYGNIISSTMFQVQRGDGTYELRETNEIVEQ
jgi:hypothetical protein